MLRDTRALYLNGFVFDELEPQLVVNMAHMAREAGAAVFFDPGEQQVAAVGIQPQVCATHMCSTLEWQVQAVMDHHSPANACIE